MPRKLDPDEYFIIWPRNESNPALYNYLKENNKTFRLIRTFADHKRYRATVTREELTYLKIAFQFNVRGRR